jgi:hypothetical protein
LRTDCKSARTGIIIDYYFARIANPRERVVEKPEDYLFSSARNYAELDALLDIELIPLQVKTFN